MVEATIALYMVLGVIIGILATMSGVGGGVFFVPIFALALGSPIPIAVGTSKAIVAVITSIGGVSYLRRRMTSVGEALPIVVSMLPGAALGAWIVAFVEPRVIEVIVGAFVIAYSVRLYYRALREARRVAESSSHVNPGLGGNTLNEEERRDRRKALVIKPVAGFAAGLIAGLTGTGGGAILVPILTSLLGMRLKEAVALSTLAISPGSLVSAAVHLATDTVNYILWASFAPGAAIGALIGPRLVAAIRVTWLRPLVASVLLVAGLRLILG